MDKNKAAYAAGYKAAQNNNQRVPALCVSFISLLVGVEIGGGIPIAKAWHAGYQAQCDEEASAILAE